MPKDEKDKKDKKGKKGKKGEERKKDKKNKKNKKDKKDKIDKKSKKDKKDKKGKKSKKCKREKIVIKDSKREEEMVVYSDHPFFEAIQHSLMPDEYRKETAELWYWNHEDTEKIINMYYRSIEDPVYWMFLVPLEVTNIHWYQVPGEPDPDFVAEDGTRKYGKDATKETPFDKAYKAVMARYEE